jgi:nucleotide sugar dehydrogenase
MIGCIGYGFVGSALCNCFAKVEKILVHDILDVSKHLKDNMEYEKNFDEFVSTLENEEHSIVFICVPTPMNIKTKKCDIRIIDNILKNLYKNITKNWFVVIKSTIPVGTIDYYHTLYGDKFSVIFNPEFLTQNNAEKDFLNQKRAIFGSNVEEITPVVEIYKNALPKIDIQYSSPRESEMVKLTLNTYWATKVAFANEMYDICEGLNINYDNVIKLVKGDSRMGKTHLAVPGPDGHRGYGGVCLPKDINNLRMLSQDVNVETPLLDVVWEKNCQVREVRDWEELIGKAVSKD